MDYSIEMIADYACHTGENPIWHADEGVLYWLDIPQGRIFRYNPDLGQADRVLEGDVVGGVTIQEDGALLLFMEAGRVAILEDDRLTTVVKKRADEEGKRFNDVIATPSGTVFCGTLAYGDGDTGSLYHLALDGTLTRVIDSVGIANGMGFSPDLAHFYFTDTVPARKIYRFRYDGEQNQLHEETVFSHLPEEDGFPDGLTVDADGYIWSARWDGGKVIRFTPSGEIDCEIEIPGARKVSSVTFGGRDYGDLYVTTAGGEDKGANGEHAGALFRIRSDSFRGRAEFRSGVGLDQGGRA